MDCKSHITPSPDGRRRVVHCRSCKVRRKMGDGEVFACPSGRRIPCGPGCQLKRLLSWWGIRDDGTCGCDAFAAEMDAWGPDGCAAREDDILGHLAEAAVRRGLPFVPPAARLLIRQAIANARKEAAHATPAPQEAAADVAWPGAG